MTESRDGTAPTTEHRCRPGRHYFPPFEANDNLGGGAQMCECGIVMIDRALGGGRVVEISDGVLRGR